MHLDDAFDFLVERLAAVPNVGGRAGTVARTQTHGHDLWLPTVVTAYWQPRIERFVAVELEDEHYQPFYDAAWELCRIGSPEIANRIAMVAPCRLRGLHRALRHGGRRKRHPVRG